MQCTESAGGGGCHSYNVGAAGPSYAQCQNLINAPNDYDLPQKWWQET